MDGFSHTLAQPMAPDALWLGLLLLTILAIMHATIVRRHEPHERIHFGKSLRNLIGKLHRLDLHKHR